ncbi:hypothetical protein KA005_55380, partial [bacterium]|nr:hypothetical protein [bacterium]
MTSHRTLRRLIAKERKIAEAEKELTNIIDQYKGDPVFDAIYWQSSFYALKIRTGLSEDFEELEKLSEINPERTEPLDNLGSIYKKYERFSDAAKQYLKCAAIEKEKAREIIWIGSAAECYALDGSFKEAYDILLKEFDDSGLDSTHYHELYKNLAEVARIEKNDNLFTAFSEKALEYSPTDSSTRFSLAYRYSKIDKNAFALYHYKFLCEHSPNDTNWNNIGVAFEQLDMKYKSVSSYRKASEEYKGTLAMANLAYRHIDGGFLDDAAEILNNARSEKDYHENVDSALSKMHEIKRKEEELEATVLQDIEGEREFRAKFAEAYALPSKVNIDAEWESKHGKISLRVEGEKISGEGLILPVAPPPAKSRVGLFLGALSNLGIPERPFRKKSISLEGKVNNRAIVYQLAITTQLPDTAALGTTTELYEGLMCIAKD